jgi:hypothetical protein
LIWYRRALVLQKGSPMRLAMFADGADIGSDGLRVWEWGGKQRRRAETTALMTRGWIW